MRILIANDGVADPGGVRTYLLTVMRGLLSRGNEVAFLHHRERRLNDLPEDLSNVSRFSVLQEGEATVLERARAWAPDICYSNNMGPLDVESNLLDNFPVIKFMHGYFGTCISNLKMHQFPSAIPCHRPFGPGCLGLYFACRCGPLGLQVVRDGYEWSYRQRELFSRYHSLVVASEYMKTEYVKQGVAPNRVLVNPLFAPPGSLPVIHRSSHADEPSVLFVGRMTHLKGGDLLIRAVAMASQKLRRKVSVTFAGDGPQRKAWENLALRLRVPATYSGWTTGQQLEQLYRQATLLAVPSVWPEPFGLIGLEAARFGVPSLAFNSGGISQWLEDGVNGILVPGPSPTASRLGETLARALSQPQRLIEMGKSARETARRMSLDAHLDRLENIFSNACGKSLDLATVAAA